MKVLLFAGAGTSVELGIPAMRPMLEQFCLHLHDIGLPASLIEAIDKIASDNAHDMEHVIDLIDKGDAGYRAEAAFGRSVDPSDAIPYQTIRGEAEWFVQHCCEQIRPAAAIQMWGTLLRTAAASNIELSIGTTNYDRAIEIAASRHNVGLHDGFADFSGREFAEWEGSWGSGRIALLKLHGSTDWYRGDLDRIIKLRHPMPLFGGLRVAPRDVDGAVESALVLPSREKIVTQPPFPSVGFQFRQRADAADVLIFVGTSLRDPHIRDICRQYAQKRPTFVVSRSGQFAAHVVPPGAKVIREGAGRFLISTMPQFLRFGDQSILEKSTLSASADEATVLQWLVTANESTARSIDRCNAIEKLAEAKISLLKEDVLSLLECTDAEVSTFALGLISQSREAIELTDAAQAKAATAANDIFASEVQLLQTLLPARVAS